MAILKQRPSPAENMSWPVGLSEVLMRVYAARGIRNFYELDRNLGVLIDPHSLGSIQTAVTVIVDAIVHDRIITVAGDYDCDGATGTAVGVRGLRLLGARHVHFVVPDRFVHGYGLSPALVEAMVSETQLIITVDSGTSSVEGVRRAKELGRQVVITDHHLPGDYLPDADAIVNPNLKGDPFPSKMLAGVGVMFYVLLAVRQRMRLLGLFPGALPDLSELLDLVAIGTVADLVPLDQNNRILVQAGLERIRTGQARIGIRALLEGRPFENLVASDIAFSIAPRLNAAGRLQTMTLGVETLLSEDMDQARRLVEQLDTVNRERKTKQAEMLAQAEEIVSTPANVDAMGLVVYDPTWHAGVVGLVASKVKDSMHRPTFALAWAGEDHPDEVRGSGRSITGFHLRDALAIVDAQHPGMLLKFGGHAMAAGLSMKTRDIPAFTAAFDAAARQMLTEEMLTAVIYTDGPLPEGALNLRLAKELQRHGPWGQAFPEPVFEGDFDVIDFRILKEVHLKLVLADVRDGSQVDAIAFFAYKGEDPPPRVRLAFELSINVFRERESLQLMVRHMEPAT
jgi:single-stranded-DNA-specific exonuclease